MYTTPLSLLERLRRSPNAANWERFVELFTPLLFAWTAHARLSDHDAADLVQDVFTILVEKLPVFRYDASKSFRAWLKTVLLNRLRRQLRKDGPSRRVAGGDALDGVADDDLWSNLEEEEYRRQLVHRALAIMQTDFAPETWRACWEYVVRDRSAAEVAAELGLTVNAVYLARTRVLRRLREELQGLLD